MKYTLISAQWQEAPKNFKLSNRGASCCPQKFTAAQLKKITNAKNIFELNFYKTGKTKISHDDEICKLSQACSTLLYSRIRATVEVERNGIKFNKIYEPKTLSELIFNFAVVHLLFQSPPANWTYFVTVKNGRLYSCQLTVLASLRLACVKYNSRNTD